MSVEPDRRAIAVIHPNDPDETRDGITRELKEFLSDDIPVDISLFMQPHAAPDEGSEGDSEAFGVAHMQQMFDDPMLERMAQEAARSGVKAVAYNCTSASFIRGVDGNAALCRRLASAAGVPATTTSDAVLTALRRLDVTRVSVVTPYLYEVGEKLRLFLSEAGFEVVSLNSLDLARNHASTPLDVIVDQVKQAAHPTADAVLVSCTALKLATSIPHLEELAGRPVVTANQATVWRLLGLAGVQSLVPQRGTLFDHDPE